ncbi:cupin domain-containing protein [Legionella sp. D16C41]|uniref:cupin domain-containing protein n=1 Tax=Legionella sp. D16C41 TaxID=3402688 RepID=UPI003AF746BE
MASRFRCIVTAKKADGTSFVSEDRQVSLSPLEIYDFWATDEIPASSQGENTLLNKPTTLEPSKAGTIFRFFEIPPIDRNSSPENAEVQAQEAFAAANALHCRVNTYRHPMMHTTNTIDYVVVLKGEVTLLLDQGEIKLKPFDAVVQRATNHYWLNETSEPVLMMGVLLAAKD